MTIKTCSKCKQEKDITEFNKNQSWCKSCKAECYRKYYELNIDKMRERNRQYYKDNTEKVKERNNYYCKHYRIITPERRQQIKEANNRYRRKRRKTDKNFANRTYIITRVRRCLKSKKELTPRRDNALVNLIGHKVSTLRKHFESLFEPWMNWDNNGILFSSTGELTWQIDHIIPQSQFDLSDPDQVKLCWKLENIRPILAEDNIYKREN